MRGKVVQMPPPSTEALLAQAAARGPRKCAPGDLLAIEINSADGWMLFPVVEVDDLGVAATVRDKKARRRSVAALAVGIAVFAVPRVKLREGVVAACCWRRFKGLGNLRAALLPWRAA